MVGTVSVAGLGAVASAAWMAYLFRSGTDPSRLYYGTDTHAGSILVGAALGAAMALRPATRLGPSWPGSGGRPWRWPRWADLLWRAATTSGSSDSDHLPRAASYWSG